MKHQFVFWLFITVISAQTALPVMAEEVKIEFSGLKLNANLEAAQEQWQDGPVLLITHGTLAHNGMEIIATLQGLFAEQGLSSLAINLSLGLDDRHGMYDCAVPHTHRHTDALDEIGVWLDWLKTQGVKQVVLVGHSRGGDQTAWFAAERPDPAVMGVMLVAPMTWSETYARSDYQKRFKSELAPVLKRAEDLVAAGKGAAWLEKTGFIYCPDAKVHAQAFMSYHAPDERLDTPGLLPRIKVPVLVFAGTEDDVVPDVAEKVAPLADGKHIRMQVIDGADHFFRDLYADEVVEHASAFIESL
jgi:pimeloyl-ACP methyl ester carboxylesterase